MGRFDEEVFDGPFLVSRVTAACNAWGASWSSASAADLEKYARPLTSCDSLNSWRVRTPQIYANND